MRLNQACDIRQYGILLIAAAAILWASACTARTPIAAAPATAAPGVHTPTFPPTSTPAATATPWASPTLPATGTPLPPATVTITPDAVLAEVKLLGAGWRENYDYFFSFQFNQPVDARNYRLLVEEKVYTCQVLAGFPNRLYCIGPGAKVLTTAEVRLYQVGSQVPAFEKDVWIPYFTD